MGKYTLGSNCKEKQILTSPASGRAVALNLAESGYSKLILVDECYNQLSVVATECQERALPEAAVLLLTCDFGNPQAINNLMIQAVEQAGRIDCVANCAPLDFCPRSTTDLSAQQLKIPGEGVERQASVLRCLLAAGRRFLHPENKY